MAAAVALLDAARAGEEQAFVQLTAPHRPALHRHCYRMLGGLDDADDALQETLLRAWQGIGAYEPRAPLPAWLHRIGTNVCLRMIEQRGRHAARLDPYPDHLLREVPAPEPGPAALAEQREHIGLAFVAALQHLGPRQRTVLLLRDVLDWPAIEVAAFTGDSVAAVNSALQRARAAIERETARGAIARVHAPPPRSAEAALLRRFQEAWAGVDIDALIALFADDITLAMPPEDIRLAGARQVGDFFATTPLDGRLERITLVPAAANGQPALAAYAREDGDDVARAYGVMVLALDGERIAGITGFPRRPEVFTRLGLPLSV